MAKYRFRNEGELLVLQVYEPPKANPYSYQLDPEGVWRDAKVTDFGASQLVAIERDTPDFGPQF